MEGYIGHTPPITRVRMNLLADKTLRIREGLYFAAVQGEGVLLDLVEDRYWGFYDLSASIWQGLLKGYDRDKVLAELTKQDLSADDAEEALEAQLQSWQESGLLIPIGHATSPCDLSSKTPGTPTTNTVGEKETKGLSLVAFWRLWRARNWAAQQIKTHPPNRLLSDLIDETPFQAHMWTSTLRIIGAYRTLRRLFFRKDDCLMRTLTLTRALQTTGVPCDVCFGVKKIPFLAHAWVEIDGRSVDRSEELKPFTVVARF